MRTYTFSPSTAPHSAELLDGMHRKLGIRRVDPRQDSRLKPLNVRLMRGHIREITTSIVFPSSDRGSMPEMYDRLRYCNTPQEVVDCLRATTSLYVRSAVTGYRPRFAPDGTATDVRRGEFEAMDAVARRRFPPPPEGTSETGLPPFEDANVIGYNAGQDGSWNALATIPKVSLFRHGHRPSQSDMRLMGKLAAKVVVAMSDVQRDVFTVMRKIIADPDGTDGYDWRCFHLVDRRPGPTLELTPDAVDRMGEVAQKELQVTALWTGCPGTPSIPSFHAKCVVFADEPYFARMDRLDIVDRESPAGYAFRKAKRWLDRRLKKISR